MSQYNRNLRTTQEQLQFYADFCEKHPEINNEGRDSQALWKDLTKGLNSLRGPTRSTTKWRLNLMNCKKQMEFRKRKSTNLVSDDTDYNDGNDKTKRKYADFLDGLAASHEHSNGYSTTDDTDTDKSRGALSKRSRSTQEQLHFYKRFCRQHPEFLLSKRSVSRQSKLWNELVTALNAMTGPTRTIPKWLAHLKSWQTQKNFRARLAQPKPNPMPKPPIAEFISVETQLQIAEVVSMPEQPVQNSSSQRSLSEHESNDYCSREEEERDGSLLEDDIKEEPDDVEEASEPCPLAADAPNDDIESQATEPKAKSQLTHDDILRQILRCLKRREQREEIAIRQQEETTTALEQLNSTLILMNQTLMRINQKMDKL